MSRKMRLPKNSAFRTGQVVWLGYAAQYRRIFRVNKYGLCVGTKRSNVCVQFSDVRPLTKRERGLGGAHSEGKMRFRIHFEHTDGTEDYFDVTGETLESVRDIANQELFKRTHNAIAPIAWSEELKENGGQPMSNSRGGGRR